MGRLVGYLGIRMNNGSGLVGTLCFVAVMLISYGCLWAQELAISNFELKSMSGQAYEINFALGVNDSKEVLPWLNKGLHLKLECVGRLVLHRRLWLDKVVATSFLGYELKKNPLSQKFVLKDKVKLQEFKDKDLNKLITGHLQGLHMVLDPGNKLLPGKEYELELEIVLARTDVPLWVKRTIFFWDWETIARKVFVLEIQ